jgi:hypothetical protein
MTSHDITHHHMTSHHITSHHITSHHTPSLTHHHMAMTWHHITWVYLILNDMDITTVQELHHMSVTRLILILYCIVLYCITGHLYRYCQLLNNKLSDPKLNTKTIYHFSGNHPHKRANAAFLICAWQILYMVSYLWLPHSLTHLLTHATRCSETVY